MFKISMDADTKRLFFGMEVKAPWPDNLPYGRLLDETHRHMTLAFLGNVYYPKVQKALPTFPKPTFKVGFAAKFDQCLFLPPKHPHVVAWHVEWMQNSIEILKFQESVIKWLQEKDFATAITPNFLPHVTLARSPFNKKLWRKKFVPLPLIIQDIHLYESLGNLKYKPIWSYSLLAPFEEIEHTADIAYIIRGYSLDHLYYHAALALCFNFIPSLPYLQIKTGFVHLEDVIIELNYLVAHLDQEIGCPFKAVSFHNHLEKKDNFFSWEMIIDV